MIRLLSAFILLLFIISCFGNKDNNDRTIEEITFRIDDSKLSHLIVDDSLQIQFRAPKKWKPLEEEQANKFLANMDSLNQSEADIFIKPKYFFVDSSINCFLMVHTVSLKNDSFNDNNIEAIYESYLSKQLGEHVLRRGKFNKDGMLMTQYVIKDGPRVLFKLFFKFEQDKLVQFDYFVLSTYEDEIKAIESSIGSIKKLNKGG